MNMNWKKFENEKGFPYYLNESTNSKQWDHPKFDEIKQRLDDCNYIKYAGYRVASKFRVLQQSLFLNAVPLSIINGVFEKHRLGKTENTLRLESYDLEAVLYDIFFASNKQNHLDTNVDLGTELTMNLMYNCYDRERVLNIDVLSAKIILALLSDCKLMDLYKFLYNLSSDHNNCITRLRLQSMLAKVTNIVCYLNESASYGQFLIQASMEECFNGNPGLVGINEDTFFTWFEKGPQIFSWFPILQRLKISENVLHRCKCSVCHLSPLVGLLYKCLKCSKYLICQRCFFTGRTTNPHKSTHSLKEYCKENVKSFSRRFSSKIGKILRCSLNVNESCLVDMNIIDNKTLKNNDKSLLLKPSENQETRPVEPLSSPLSQLRVIIRQLELQNRELLTYLSTKNNADVKTFLEDHRVNIAAEIDKLKILKRYINEPAPETQTNTIENKWIESTPMVTNVKLYANNLKGIGLFSPIESIKEETQGITPLNMTNSNGEKSGANFDEYNSLEKSHYSLCDLSTWIGGQPQTGNEQKYNNSNVSKLNHKPPNELDEALVKLQQILANNFSLDESLGNFDNFQLKYAVNEVEGMLSSIIENVEYKKAS